MIVKIKFKNGDTEIIGCDAAFILGNQAQFQVNQGFETLITYDVSELEYIEWRNDNMLKSKNLGEGNERNRDR